MKINQVLKNSSHFIAENLEKNAIYTINFYIHILRISWPRKKDITQRVPIATVYDQKLYKEDIEDLLPKNINKKDSVVLVRSIIKLGYLKSCYLGKLLRIILVNDNTEINKLVTDYRQALLINGYKERLIKQQLDTIISEQEISDYYNENGKNFRLNEELIKTRLLHFSSDLIDKKK